MSYQALYRAWRPDTFSEICGQDAIVKTLKHQVESGHIAHAYLFCGTRGTGKTTAAKVLARAINCLDPQNGDPCGKCEICLALKRENVMDVQEIDAASNNGVDEIRELREKINYPPTLTRYKVYIIDEVHMLSTGAFNALLKTLEEPPEHAVFILATTEPQKLPATILSRCQRFDFHRISVETIVDRLRVVLKGIAREADDDALNEIARAAEGAMRDALSLLDVCLAFTDGCVTAELARDVLGTTGRAFMFDFIDDILRFDAAAALGRIDEAVRRGSDPAVFARDAAAHLRGVLLAQYTGEKIRDLLEITAEDAQRFMAQAKAADADQLTRALDLFLHVDADMKWSFQSRTMLELATVRACHPEQESDAGESERLTRLEKLMESGVPARAAAPVKVAAEKPAAPVKKPAAKSAAPTAAVDPPPAYDTAIAQLCADPNSRSIARLLGMMRFVGIENGVVNCEFTSAQAGGMKVVEAKSALVEAALTAAFGTPMHFHIGIAGVGAAALSTDAKRLIEQSYEVFGRDKIELTD